MLWILFSFVVCLFNKCLCDKLFLSIDENAKPSSSIGNLRNMIKNQTNFTPVVDFKSFYIPDQIILRVNTTTGDIWLKSSLDREEICQSLKNCEGPTFLNYLVHVDNKIFELKVEVVDLNDNVPFFTVDEKIISIPEDISKFTKYPLPLAYDKDSEKFGVTRYELQTLVNKDDARFFSLFNDAVTKKLYLVVKHELDRESKEIFEFSLLAFDERNNSCHCRIKIRVTDINDNSPQWRDLPYRANILECSIDPHVAKLKADDRDDATTVGGQVHYQISESAPKAELIIRAFYIDGDTLYVNVGTQLRSLSDVGHISVYVLAVDGGERRSETSVEVTITDCNDHWPAIHVKSPMPSVAENDASVKPLTIVTVKDQDRDLNSEFSCNLNDSSHVTLKALHNKEWSISEGLVKIFQLETVDGVSFDRELTPRYSVEIVCVDSGQPPMSSSSVVTILVEDANDNRPMFENKFRSFSISEDAIIGTEVGSVVATDTDASQNNVISYSLRADEDTLRTFSVTKQGKIQLTLNIDREKIDRYDFVIVAVDNGLEALNDSCKIVVTVLDVNDCRPEIAAEHYFSVVESHGKEVKHHNLGKLNATDEDKGHNGSLRFRLVPTTPGSSLLEVMHDGQLSIHGVIDRERGERIEVVVEVRDGGKPPLVATTTIVVDVLDLNDNKPKFVFPSGQYSNFINVSLDQQTPARLGKLNAIDPDKDLNGSFEFCLSGDSAQLTAFSVHPNGDIVLNENLKSSGARVSRLLIEVKDRGTPPLSEVSTLFIRYLVPKSDDLESARSDANSRQNEKNELNSQKIDKAGWSYGMIFIGILVATVFLAIVVIGGAFLYVCCPCRSLCPTVESGKHTSDRDLRAAADYERNNRKTDRSQSMKSGLENNSNQFLTTMRDYPYQNGDPNIVNYNLMKTYSGTSVDQKYQFRPIYGGGSYSAFHPMAPSFSQDIPVQEVNPFNDADTWEQPSKTQTAGRRSRNTSEDMESIFDNHKYNTSNIFQSHQFSTPSQSRRSDTIQAKTDSTYKVKVNHVASSFV